MNHSASLMNLSKLIFNPRNAGVRQDIARPYELHRTLHRGVEHAPNDNRLLFRIEPEGGGRRPVVLVQSAKAVPDWTPLLANGYLLEAYGPKPLEPALRIGQRLAFRLTANPTKKVAGKRIPLSHAVRQHKEDRTYWHWLHRKAEQHGFTVLAARDAPFRTASNRRKKQRYDKAEIPHFGVRFDGVLEVTDSDRLLEAIRQGIGPAKAFGFGLLSLAPAR